MSYQIALLIDAENISYKELTHIVREVRRYGHISLQAVYGDWDKPHLQNWYEVAAKNNLKIRHQTSDPQTKNSTDMKLIMDAMEVLYRTSLDVFCLVTNDADYVPLCNKIHEARKQIIGVGYKNASEAFIRACDQFIFIPQENGLPQSPAIINHTPEPAPKNDMQQLPRIRKLLNKAFAIIDTDSQGWVGLSAVGMALSQVQNGFNTDDYGHSSLSKLLQSLPDFVETQGEGNDISARLKTSVSLTSLQKLIIAAFADVPENNNGWVTLSALGSALRRVKAGFKPNNYGHATLSKLLKSMPHLVELRGKGSSLSARLK